MKSDDTVKELWSRLKTGIEVTLACDATDRQSGVRDGFRRYFETLSKRTGGPPVSPTISPTVPIVIVPRHCEEAASGLPAGNRATLELAHRKAAALFAELGDAYHFYVATEGGLDRLTVGDEDLHFVRNWTVLLGPFGAAYGCSAGWQLPPRLIASLGSVSMDEAAAAVVVPGTRRSGGIISSLTGGAENRRSAVAQSTFNALCSLFFGRLDPPQRAPR